mmetsp:Transcript_2096/g.5329  ORF Transcript_2096/g.5329 Transcript_2096/m.5329 type:complete len:235 (-) Transcript_2096:8-712(-)
MLTFSSCWACSPGAAVAGASFLPNTNSSVPGRIQIIRPPSSYTGYLGSFFEAASFSGFFIFLGFCATGTLPLFSARYCRRCGLASSKGSFHRSTPASLAMASRPFFSMVFSARVVILSLTQRWPLAQNTFLCCRLGSCHLRLCLLEKHTELALFRFVPVRSHTFLASICTGVRLPAGLAATGVVVRRRGATATPEKALLSIMLVPAQSNRRRGLPQDPFHNLDKRTALLGIIST